MLAAEKDLLTSGPTISIAIAPRPPRGYGAGARFYFAEEYHQRYLDKVPNGSCPDHSTGVSCPVGLFAKG
jgi:hypothetical protein